MDEHDPDAARRWEGASAGFEAARRPPLRHDTSWKTAGRRPWWLRDIPVLLFVVTVVVGLGAAGIVFAISRGADPDTARELGGTAGTIALATLLVAVIWSNVLWRRKVVRRGGDEDD